jgi:8-oxo-dGTP pyrophosphatase MutT (NUDIX family)
MLTSTLCFLRRDGQILLGMKKRDFGKGKWNGIGGKLEGGEEPKPAALRELREEIGVSCAERDLEHVGLFEFRSDNQELEWDVNVFFVSQWQGEPTESDEMLPRWFNESELPFDEMWPDDRIWFPHLLAGKTIKGVFRLDPTGKEILEHTISQAQL